MGSAPVSTVRLLTLLLGVLPCADEVFGLKLVLASAAGGVLPGSCDQEMVEEAVFK